MTPNAIAAPASGSRQRTWLRAVAALEICCAAACGLTPSSRLSGDWVGVEMETLGGEVSAQRAGWALGTALRFSGNTLRVTVPDHPPRQSEYRVKNADDGEMTLTLRSGSEEPRNMRLTLETDELLRWHLTQEHTVVLRRK